MHSIVAKLSFNSSRHCFAGLPKSFTNKSKDKIGLIAIKIESATGQLFTTWSGDATEKDETSGDDVIEINGLFAAKQGFKNGQEVSVCLVRNVAVCLKAQVEPVSVDDWEILEMNCTNIENNLLNQIRLVTPGHIFPIWVQKSSCIFISVGTLEPSFGSCCLLERNTELFVSTKLRSSENHNSTIEKSDDGKTFSSQNGIAHSSKKSSTLSENGFVEAKEETSRLEAGNRENKRPLSWSNKLFSYVKSFWTSDEDEETTTNGEREKYEDELLRGRELSSFFRVLPLEDFIENTNNDDVTTSSSRLCLNGDCKRMPNGDDTTLDLFKQPLNVYITQNSMASSSHGQLPNTFLSRISRLASPQEKADLVKRKTKEVSFKSVAKTRSKDELEENENETVEKNRVVTVRVILINSDAQCDKIHFRNGLCLPDGYILVSRELCRMLLIGRTSRVLLESLSKKCDVLPKEIHLHPLFQPPGGFTDEMLKMAVKRWMESNSSILVPLILDDGTLFRCFIKEGLNGRFIATFNKPSSNVKDDPESSFRSYCLINPDNVKQLNVKLIMHGSANKSSSLFHDFSDVDNIDSTFPTLDFNQLHIDQSVTDAAVEHVHLSLGRHPHFRFSCGGLLLCGANGVGKTAFANAICNDAVKHPNLAFVEILDCKMLKGKKPETIRQLLQLKFDELTFRQPSIFVLDDLDHIAPSIQPEQEMSGIASHYTRIAEIIRDLMQTEGFNGSSIAVVSTSVSRNSLHPLLTSARGSHVFTKILDIQPPNSDDRMKMIERLVERKKNVSRDSIKNLNLFDVASQTEGFVASDLDTLVNRAIHANLSNNSNARGEDIVLFDDNFKRALMDFKPVSLRNVSLLIPDDEMSWSDVGGLHDVRKILIQTLQWPSKYPKLFSKSPLRIRSGLLLYGAPGTGKTHLAAVVAKEFRLNFISIKGPELFNKYIGASEQAVRDTFARAQSAKPCILFFDEFDSLAPRRGHDNTGVTDRVVNQLLTQLDGVETLEGVFVLAATSRPDLIDSALLRPGRLDKAIHCPIPSKDERLEILEALSRKMRLSDDIDLRFIAERCEHFTGADFKALLYNAQLESIHEKTANLLSSSESSYFKDLNDIKSEAVKESREAGILREEDEMIVTHDHLMSASNGLQPSVSPSERRRYQQIYEAFIGSRGGHFVPDVAGSVGQRVTLA